MSAFENRYKEEYLVHVITVMHLIKQKGMAQDVKEAFGVFG
jgi:hypothetical protein